MRGLPLGAIAIGMWLGVLVAVVGQNPDVALSQFAALLDGMGAQLLVALALGVVAVVIQAAWRALRFWVANEPYDEEADHVR